MISIRHHERAGRGAEGIFTLRVYRRGVLIEEFREKNLLVDGLNVSQAHLIAGDTTNRFVTKIGFGSSGTAATPSDTALTNLFSRAIGNITYPTANSVQWAWQLAQGEANGLSIREFGLLTANNTLIARRTRATAIPKDSDISLTGSWGISF